METPTGSRACERALAVYTGGQRDPAADWPRGPAPVEFMHRPILRSLASLSGRALLLAMGIGWMLCLAPGAAGAGPRVEQGLPLADPAPTGQTDLQARVLFTSNLLGDFEPCKCPDIPLGGLSQLAARVDAVRSGPVPAFWLDSGDRLFRLDMAQIGTEEAERRLRAILLVDAGSLVGLDAMGVGRLDLGAGLAYLQKLAQRASYPFISANLVDEEGALHFQPSVLLVRGGQKLGITSVVSSDVEGEGYTATSPYLAARREVRALRAQGAELVVVLSNLGDEAATRVARTSRADAILSSRSRQLTPEGRWIGRTVVGEAGARGRYLGDLRWFGSGAGSGPHLVLTTLPVYAEGATQEATDRLLEEALRRLADPVLGVPPIPPGGIEPLPSVDLRPPLEGL